VIKSLMRQSRDFSLWLLIVLAIVVVIAFGAFMWLFVSAVHAWSTGISDPTERGLSYIAIAIVAHAFLQSDRHDYGRSSKKEGP